MSASELLRQLNQKLYPTAQKLVTHTLFNRGYKRYDVELLNETSRKHLVAWAKNRDSVELYFDDSTWEQIIIRDLPIAPFFGRQMPDGTVVGDLIVLDDEELRED